jgi:2-keto-4-pentenoate hydratase/2-oxohepta-3-ene-1,7-dioic acid hydratase in catechol pathway
MPRYVATARGLGRLLADSTVDVIAAGIYGLDDALSAGATAEELARLPAQDNVAINEEQFRSPIRRPSKVWLVGWAYADHAAEVGRAATDDYPRMFLKASSSLTGPRDDIRLPPLAPNNVDYEGEIAVVVGRRATDISEADAWDYILGYAAANDVSARDVQRGAYNGGNPDPSKAKSFDTFAPLGPCVCTVDEYADPEDIELKTIVDGELRQHARSTSLIYGFPAIVSFASRLATLEPGDVILTGTPSGVGHPTGRFLSPGNVVRVEVEGVGAIENRVVA